MAEFSLIERYFKHCTPQHQHTVDGIGDDCAVSNVPSNVQLVSCVDTLVAGRHFPVHTPAHAIGWKSVAVNLSDIASMGATPYAILLALSLPNVDETWLAEFSRGLADCCQHYGVQLIGGDTTQSPTLSISITAFGWVKQGQAITRFGAKVGDYICLTGEIGSASYALPFALKQQPCIVQDALNYPQPQVEFGQALRDYASAMIDISDGLAQDLGHILNASHVGAILHLDDLPIHSALQSLPLMQQWQHALAGGDDYQLCFCISPQQYAEFIQHTPFRPIKIGEIVATHGIEYRHQQQTISLNMKGYQHFD